MYTFSRIACPQLAPLPQAPPKDHDAGVEISKEGMARPQASVEDAPFMLHKCCGSSGVFFLFPECFRERQDTGVQTVIARPGFILILVNFC